MSDQTEQLILECPHCSGSVDMTERVDPPEPLVCPHCRHVIPRRQLPAKLSAKKIAVLIAVFCLLGAVGLMVVFALRREPAPDPQPQIAGPTAALSVSTNQFTISGVRLEKEGALRYVQGTASNGLAQQRFGVKIHLELLDINELRVGSASDYRPVVQPNEVWQFRALVVEPGAVSAAVTGIQEDQ